MGQNVYKNKKVIALVDNSYIQRLIYLNQITRHFPFESFNFFLLQILLQTKIKKLMERMRRDIHKSIHIFHI